MARIKGGAVLISTVHIRSVGLGPSGVGVAALTAGGHPPRRRGTGSSPDFGISVLPSSNRSGLGSGGTYSICVIHLRQRNGGLGPGRTLARRGAALGLGVRRRAGVQGARGLGRVCNSAEEHAQDMCKHGWRSCGAVRGCRAFASVELRQESPPSGAQAPRVRPGPN